MFSVSHKQRRGAYMRANIPWLFDHYASQTRTLLALFQAFFHGYYARVVPALSSIYFDTFLSTPYFRLKLCL